jgi:hypothetical protein
VSINDWSATKCPDLEFSASAPGRIRTRDPLLRRQLLYPTELRAPGDHCAWRRSHVGHVRVAFSGDACHWP